MNLDLHIALKIAECDARKPFEENAYHKLVHKLSGMRKAPRRR